MSGLSQTPAIFIVQQQRVAAAAPLREVWLQEVYRWQEAARREEARLQEETKLWRRQVQDFIHRQAFNWYDEVVELTYLQRVPIIQRSVMGTNGIGRRITNTAQPMAADGEPAVLQKLELDTKCSNLYYHGKRTSKPSPKHSSTTKHIKNTYRSHSNSRYPGR